MGKARRLPRLVGGQHASRDLTGRHAGQLSWVGRVAVLFLGVVGILTVDASTAAAGQATTSGDYAALAVNANGDGAPSTEADGTPVATSHTVTFSGNTSSGGATAALRCIYLRSGSPGTGMRAT